MADSQTSLPSPASSFGARFRAWGRRRVLSATGNTGDTIFRAVLFFSALRLLLIVMAMIVAMAANSKLSLRQFGFGFLTSSAWNPIQGEFGALPFIYGTLMSSIIALIIAVPLSLGVAIFLVEQIGRASCRER